ncbi:zinc-ribbon domain-containing protein [Profundibacter sp.]
MRLICPNCDAQYEVDDNVIPTGGRDVQCSSCGQTWFQQSASKLEDIDQPHTPEPETPARDDEPAPEPVAELVPEQEAEPEQEPEAEHNPDLEPRKPDDAVLDVLRQEAAIETEARQHETRDGLETQPDLGLDQSPGDEPPQAAAVNQRTARLRGIEPEIDKQAARSDLLPDIEEINSSLQAESAAETEDALTEKKRDRSGFRLGFGSILILATLLLLAYIYAPQITAKIPASEPFMISYVEKVDGLRLWLDQLMKSATSKMSDTATDS